MAYVVVNDNADTQAGTISVFGSAPVTNNGTTTPNTTTAAVTETALIANAVTVGNVATIAGIKQSYSPAGNVAVTVAAGTPVAYDFVGNVQSGTVAATGLTTVTVIGGAAVNVSTNANKVVVGAVAVNGLVPVAYENATGNVNVVDTAVVGKGAGGASVTVQGGVNVNISNAGGAVTIGTPLSPTLTIAPTGTEVVTDTAPLTYDDVLNTGTNRDITTVGGTAVNITTNAGAVTVGTAAGNTGSEPTGTISVVDTASPGVNAGGKALGSDVPITIFGGTNVAATSANGAITVGAGTAASNPTGSVVATTKGIETGGQFASGTTINGAAAVFVNTTGAGAGGVTAGVKATPISGVVSINDTFSGTQNADSFTVVGGVAGGSPNAVSITTTKSSGAITVGGIAPTLNVAGTTLSNGSVFANGNVSIVNETPAGTGVAGAANLWGTGLTTVNELGATTVTIAGGGGATVTDEQTTKATGGANAGKAVGASTLATVSLDHVGTGGSATTITSDALTSLTAIDDTAGDAYTVVATPALALALTIGNDAALNKVTTVTDATASSVAVTDNGKATAGTLALVAAKATSASFTTTAALTANLTADTALTTLTLANTASLNLGDLSASNVAVTAGSGSTGNVTITNLNGATSSFNGGGSTGNNSITLTSNTVKNAIRAGGGTTNTITANYGAGAGDVALSSSASGFNVLGVGKSASSTARQDSIMVAAIGAVGATFTVSVSVPAGSNPVSYTYTQVAGDTTATVAAALVSGLNTALSSKGIPAFVTLTAPGSTTFNVIAQAGASLTTAESTTGGAATLTPTVVGGFTTNFYNATGFTALTVGAVAGPVSFSNVAASETLNITASPGSTITLAPTGTTNALNIYEGIDGPATGAGAGTPGIAASVATTNTQNLGVFSQGTGGSTVNTLAVTDPQLISIGVAGDELLTLSIPAVDPAFPGLAVADSAFSSVANIVATGTTISTQPNSKNVTDVTGVTVAYTGVTVTGGASTIKAQGVQGTDFLLQTDTVALAGGTFFAGETVTVTLTPTTGYYVATSGPNKGSLVLGAIPMANQTPITAKYVVQASDISGGGNSLATDQNVAAQLAGAINAAAGTFFGASVVSNPTTASLVISGTTNAQAFTDTNNIAVPPTSTVGASPIVYTKAADNYTTGSGGGVITLGTGGGFNPYATVTANGSTYYGVFDTGYEQLNLAASAAKTDVINVGANAVATFGGVNGTGGQNGGVSGFVEGAVTTADALNYLAPGGYNVITNIKAASTLNLTTGSQAANIASALDPSGNLANALANVNFSSANGLITVVGNGNSQPPSAATILAAAEIIVALAAPAAGAGTIAAVSNGAGATYVVAATAGNAFSTFAATKVAPGSLSANTGLSVVELLGTPIFSGFGSLQSPSLVSPTNPLGVAAGLGAAGAVLANVANVNAGNGGVAGTSKTYNDSGFSLDTVTAAQAAPTTTTTFTNLAPASQLNIAGAAGTNVGTVAVTQLGTSGTNSLIVDFQTADTVQSLTIAGDGLDRLVADASATLSNLVDSTGSITTLVVTGASNLSVGSISAAALTTIDASKQTGALTLTGVNINALTIKGATGGDNLTASGAADTITVGSATSPILGNVAITATGNGDVVTLVNEAFGSTNNLNVGGVGDTISVDDGTNNISGGAVVAPSPTAPFGLQVPLQSGDTINLADGGTDNVWVGGNSTVNLTGNTILATTAFGTSAGSAANIVVKGDLAGTTSAGFATGGTGALTTITGADVAVGTPISLTFLNTTTEALAGGTSATAFVNIQGAASLSAALDTDVNQSLLLDAQINAGADTSVIAGVLNLNAKTAVLSWFQYSGSTYVVEAVNNTGAAAAHVGLQAGNSVVKLTGLVDLSHTALAGGTLTGVP